MSDREQPLRFAWSKRERDYVLHYPSSPDGHFMHSFFHEDGEGGAFLRELERRGYDPTTFRFEAMRSVERRQLAAVVNQYRCAVERGDKTLGQLRDDIIRCNSISAWLALDSFTSAAGYGSYSGSSDDFRNSRRDRADLMRLHLKRPREAEICDRTVAAVLLIRDAGREGWQALLARRPEGKPFGGMWETPGGAVQPGESWEDAARREAREELCVDVVLTGIAARVQLASKEFWRMEPPLPPSTDFILFYARLADPSAEPQPLAASDLAWVEWERMRYPRPGGRDLTPGTYWAMISGAIDLVDPPERE